MVNKIYIALNLEKKEEELKNLKAEGKKVLLVLPEVNKNVYLSARNIQKAEVMIASNINAYKVLNADVMIVSEKSVQAIDEILTK